jgi:hypothetical protein
MRVSLFVAAVAVLAFALPAQAGAARLAGVVVAKESQRGTVVLASARGVGTTVRISSTRAKAGDRVEISGRRLRDGTFFATALAVRSHTRSALIRGVVVRQLSRATLLATGRSVIRIQHGASSAPLRAGSGVTFRVRIDDHGDLDEQGETHSTTTGSNVQIEGKVVSTSPFVVSVEGLPIGITVPSGMTLPTGLAVGDRIELTVSVAAGNVFTLVSIDENENDQGENDQGEVEVTGTVVQSTTSQLVVLSHGMTFTFAAPTGVTLPIIPTGTSVEAKGVSVNGQLTLVRVKTDDDGDGGGGGGGGDDGGGGGH